MTLTSWGKHVSTTALVVIVASILTACAPSLKEIPLQVPPQSEQLATPEATAAPGDQPEGLKELTIEVLHKANYNPFERNNGKSFRALKSIEQYRAELGLHSIETAKPVDYKTSQVLSSSIGEVPTGGYKVTATKAEEYADRVVVTVVLTTPGPDCITTQAVTHPFEIVVIPSVKRIEISERKQVEDC